MSHEPGSPSETANSAFLAPQMRTSSSPPQEWYFRGFLSYRNRVVSAVVVGVVMAAISLAVGWFVSVSLSRYRGPWEAKDTFLLIFFLLYVAVFGWGGWGVLFHVWRGTKWEIGVGQEGVLTMRGFVPWERIRWFEIGWFEKQLHPFVGRKWGTDLPLLTDRGLSADEADRLVEMLRERVGPAFPHVRLP